MKRISFSEAKEFKNSNICTAYEYDFHEKSINGAVIKLLGRYPDEGFVYNTECKEMTYVVEGGGKLVLDTGKLVEVEKGDMLFLEKEERFYWEGEMDLLVFTAPAWNSEQYRHTK